MLMVPLRLLILKNLNPRCVSILNVICNPYYVQINILFHPQIAALAKKQVESALHDDWNLEISETLVAAFGSRAHLEKEAIATVLSHFFVK